MIEHIAFLGYQLYKASLVNSDYSRDLMRDLHNPQPGDLVFEVSSRHPSGIGRLILSRTEFVPYKEEEGGYNDQFWYIETTDGKLMRWFNCQFIKIPEPKPAFFDVADAIVRHGLDQLVTTQS
jgi:hypothetical protein